MLKEGLLMTALTKDIATDIVERTMQILTHNINVMDERGIIIGSGQKNRLGQLHEGALQVIKQNKRMDIEQNESKYLIGTKPGINLPIVFENKVVGVIGISGDPQSISQFGELVKMGAELTLKQAALTEQLQWDERLREELVNEIIYNQTDLLSMERAARMGIDLSMNRIPILIEFESKGLSEESISKQKQISFTYLKGILNNEDLIASVEATKLVVLKKYSSENHITDTVINELEKLLKQFNYRSVTRWRAGIGVPFNKLENAKESYTYAHEVLKVGRVLAPQKDIYLYEDFLFPILLSQFNLPESNILGNYDTLVSEDKSGELQKTLQAYIEGNGDLSEIAEELFIHRNTLRYRLEKIKRITGKNPRNINDLLNLYISHIAYKLKDSFVQKNKLK